MAGSSLLMLLDDIATVLDDVAVMSKVAAKKTAGVLGDDLALNAQQVTGVSAERELPVVIAVAVGSLKNKLILVPAAILISLFLPWLITRLLMLGGAFLCFEGAEKLVHQYLHADEHKEQTNQRRQAIADTEIDLVSFEKEKIKGAIRTDFILSAEIIVISLGIVAETPLVTQVAVLVVISLLMTIGVYGLVAALVKIDDLGLHLLRNPNASVLTRTLGRSLVAAAPKIMKVLAIAGTIAMFLVGGGIIAHGIAPLHHLFEHWQTIILAGQPWYSWFGHALMSVLNGILGVLCGAVLVALFEVYTKNKNRFASEG